MQQGNWTQLVRLHTFAMPAGSAPASRRPQGPALPRPILVLNKSTTVTLDLADALVDALAAMGCIEGGEFVPGASARRSRVGPASVDGGPFRCWLLTEVGAAALNDHLGNAPIATKGLEAVSHLAAAFLRLAERPLWNEKQGELWWRGQLIKPFKRHAVDQRCLLRAFQAAGWVNRIHDPLPVQSKKSPKKHLHDTIQSLNRGQKPLRPRFRGDGTGRGIRWEEAE